MRFSFVPQLGEDWEHLTFQGMVRACDADLNWQVSDVGSLWEVPSSIWTMKSWSGCWSEGSMMERSFD